MLPVEVLEPDEIVQDDPEDVRPCTVSFHPAHIKCGVKASYVILAQCSDCEVGPKYVCANHCTRYYRALLANTWCVCTKHPAHHYFVNVIVRGV